MIEILLNQIKGDDKMFRFLDKSKTRLLIANILLIFTLFFSFSCEKRKHSNPYDPNYEGGGNPTMNKIARSGMLKLISGSTLHLDDLEVVSFAKSINLIAPLVVNVISLITFPGFIHSISLYVEAGFKLYKI